MSPIGMINVIIVFVVTVIVGIIVFLYDSKNIQSVSNMMKLILTKNSLKVKYDFYIYIQIIAW